MKNKFKYILLLLLPLMTIACKDDDTVIVDEENYSSEREFMTMFRKDDNTGKGDSDPYRCQVVDINDIQLYWYGVKDCAGYELKYALQPNVSSGLASDWEDPAKILWDTIVGPDVTDLLIKDLQYSTDYRFAIRTLSHKGEGYHSKWYGYGSGRQWADWMGLATEPRYEIPEVIVVNNITFNTLRVNFDRAYATSGDKDGAFKEYFELDENDNFVMQNLLIEASATNPNATVPDTRKKYAITAADFERGYIDIDGLQENSVYLINVENVNIPVHWDAIYNTCVIRMDGTPGEPILIEHYCDPNDTIPGAVSYNASRLDTIINNYNSDASLAEGTIFELEGGKTYYLAGNVSLCKGMTLRTQPGSSQRAKVLMNGMSTINGAPQVMNFMFGRQPQAGELGGINIKSLIFEDIDFDCPLAKNFGDGSATGNYFINMYSNGMAVTLQSFEVRNCSFQRMVRGFVRVQGVNRKNFELFLIENCLFYNNGFYDNNGRGYAWIAGDGNHAKSNIYQNMIFRNNTFYDSPRTCFFTDNGKNLAWGSNIQYNITLENNTFVNYSTRSSGRKIFDLRYLPGGSKITCKKNLFILTRQDSDDRNLYMEGMDIRQINGSGEITFDVQQNYSTNAFLTNNNIFSSGAFSANSNSAGKWSDFNVAGKDELNVHLGETGISPTELMSNPNPPYINGHADMHETDTDRIMNGLKFNNTEKVRNHEIYKLGIGDPRWRF